MATFGALCPSPSASLSATLSYSSLHSQCPSNSISPTAKIQDELQSDTSDDSSSDKENSPSYISRKLNRANSTSPVMASLLQRSPVKKHMSFTPQRTRHPPRAWERRPATPFVARNEGQKIWKRIPLQELGIEVNQQIPRRETEEKQNYLRVVKRQRLDKKGDNAAKDECDRIAIAIGTKWVEDFIEKDGSPKKKSRSQQDAFATMSTDPRNETRFAIDNLSSTSAIDDTPDDTAQNIVEKQAAVTGGSNSDNGQNLSSGQGVKVAGIEELDDHTDLKLEEAAAENPEIAENGKQCEDMAGRAISQTMESTTLNSTETLSTNNEEVSTTLGTVSISTDHTSLSSSLSNIVMSDTTTVLPCSRSLFTGTSVPPATGRATATFLASDHDETAFLRDFLERAQALKATRSALSPQKKMSLVLAPYPHHDQFDFELKQNDETRPTEEIEDDDLSPPIETAEAEEPLFTIDSNVVSPTRRSTRTSTRAASSRLPRFQTSSTTVLPSQQFSSSLPATIQLKRAVGSEFIFNAKSQENLTMVTRSNTKRNQGDAIHVAQRLAQLKKELDIQQQEQLVPEVAASLDTQVAGLNMITDKEIEHSRVRKRKRGKVDEAKSLKIQRTVRWPSEEDLVQYREPIFFLESTETSDDSENIVLTVPPILEVVVTDSISNVVISAESDSSNKSNTGATTADSIGDSSKLKVRRIRKIKLDSVNGTPAPKTRGRSLLDSEVVEPNATAAMPVVSASSSSIRRSSRMPVPISTPIPLPGLTTSKSKAKTASKDKENSRIASKNPSSISKPATETGTAATGTKHNENPVDQAANSDTKLVGRRQLRRRS